MNAQIGKSILNWARGFLLATLLAWLAAPYFLDTMVQWEWSDELDCYIQPAGHVQRWRSEGWGTTRFGRYGISAIPDIRRESAPKVAIWGDSFVEAFQVSDPEKTARQVTDIWKSRHHSDLLGVGLGMSGRAVPDYYFLMSNYEKTVDPICHFILIVDMHDIGPDGVRFVDEPRLEFRKGAPRSAAEVEMRRQLRKFRPEFLFIPLKNSIKAFRGKRFLRFDLGRAELPKPESPLMTEIDDPPPLEAWRFVLRSLKEKTRRPIAFIYAPPIPRLVKGRLLDRDPYHLWVRALERLCDEHGIGFIDMTPRFADYYRRKRAFALGFNNGGLGHGHINPRGHRLLAEAICDYIGANIDAVHAD